MDKHSRRAKAHYRLVTARKKRHVVSSQTRCARNLCCTISKEKKFLRGLQYPVLRKEVCWFYILDKRRKCLFIIITMITSNHIYLYDIY